MFIGIAAALVIVAGIVAFAMRKESPQQVAPPVAATQATQAPPAPSTATLIATPASADANVQKAYFELQQLSSRVQSKRDAAVSRGLFVADSKWDDVVTRIADLQKTADSGDFKAVHSEGEKILKVADDVIRQHGKPTVVAATPKPPIEKPASPVPTATHATTPAAPTPQPASPAPATPIETKPAPAPAPAPAADAKAEIQSFIRKVAAAYQNHDVDFFREHHARFTDAVGNAIRNAPSVRVDLDVESINVTDADHARAVVQRTDEFSGGAPPQKARLAYVLERQGGVWKISKIERP
jgi:hypothetical protein